MYCFFFFFSSRSRHTTFDCDWSSDVCSSDLPAPGGGREGQHSAGVAPARFSAGTLRPELGCRSSGGGVASREHGGLGSEIGKFFGNPRLPVGKAQSAKVFPSKVRP